jgi:acyl-CoA thioesterase FadM
MELSPWNLLQPSMEFVIFIDNGTLLTLLQTAWWNYLGVTNMLSESGIMGQALLVIVRIQTDFSRKAGLSSVFLIRVV